MIRYQVFISSTYKDLVEERGIVKKALLEKNCFPAGMEEFPAIDQKQFEYIKKVIDDSDYYILILGGKIGTVCKETNESYTYMEYKYALDRNIPIIVYVKKDEEGNIVCYEKKKKRKKYYEKFVSRVTENRMCAFFNKKEELAGLVHFSLNEIMKMKPRFGWKKVEYIEINNDEGLLLRGRLLSHFIIGKNIYDYYDEYFTMQSFGQTQQPILIKYGVGTQGEFKLLVFIGEFTLNCYYEVNESEFTQQGALLDNTKIQISLARMGNYEEVLLFLSVGNLSSEMITKIYKFSDMGIKEIYQIEGQEFMFVDYDLIAPYGSQGLFEHYVYCKNSVYHIR